MKLHPKTAERLLAQIQEIDDSPGDIEVIPINLSLALNAPIDTVREMQVVYTLTRQVMLQILDSSTPGKPHPQLLGYLKESASQIEKIHNMTETVQHETNLEKLKIVRALIKANPDLNEEMKIQFIKSMRNKEEALKSVGNGNSR